MNNITKSDLAAAEALLLTLAGFRADARADALRPLLTQFEENITTFQNRPDAARAWTDAAHMVRDLLK